MNLLFILPPVLTASIFVLYHFVRANNEVNKMTFSERHNLAKMHERSLVKKVSFEDWKVHNFNILYFTYRLIDSDITFDEFTRGLFDGNIIIEFEYGKQKRKRIY